MIQLSAVRIEGGLFSADLFEQILAEEIEGQKPADFGLEGKRTVREAIDTAYTEAQGLWAAYQQLREKDPEKAEDTTATRTRWVVPFLKLLGYSPTLLRSGYNLDGVIYAISHTAEKGPAAPPIHIIALNKDLDKVDPSGRPRFAPHTLMQEYLNRTEESLWGIITNGRTIRLLRDSTYLRKQAYVEFDLEAIFEKGLYNDFALLYRLLHRSRLPKGGQHVHDCVLERYYHSSIEQGGRIREGLRKGVERAILILANGLLQQNPQLQEAVFPETKVKHPYTAADLYADLLRIVYRIIFLLVAEDRKLVGDQEIYREFYSLSRFRKYIANRAHYNEHKDLWISLNSLWQILRDERGEAAKALGLSVLDGDLFRPIPIESYDLDNRTLLEAMSCLLRWEDEETRTVRNVNYGALDVEELGSVYESLLENHPRIDPTARQFDFDQGAERKSTGSYYTPSSLVHELIQSALAPVVERRLKGLKEKEEQEQAILSISVVDPACGSGHFLLAAARYLAKRLAQIRVGKEEEPPPSLFREAVRDVVSHCIYGVDLNPLAAELCKVALWIETNTGDKPLTFLDHHIKCGNALLGILDPDIIEDGIPDEAYKPVSGDQKDLARKVRNLNAAFLATKQLTLGFEEVATDNAEAVRLAQELHAIRDDSLDGIHAKQRKHDQLQKTIEQTKCVYDLYTAAFFQRRAREEEETEGQEDLSRFITSETVHKARTGSLMPGKGPAAMESLADKHRFFHWPLEFPEVFAKGGFDVVLGNPPWERIKLQEREFFAARDPKIADAGNAAERKKLIRQLEETNPALYEEFQDAVHAAEATSRFLRYSREYPLTARGDINTYSVFAERMRRLRREEGRAGIIVPTGIATDDTNKKFFADLVEKKELVSLYDFDNRMKLFPAVISLMKFCLLTMGIENEENVVCLLLPPARRHPRPQQADCPVTRRHYSPQPQHPHPARLPYATGRGTHQSDLRTRACARAGEPTGETGRQPVGRLLPSNVRHGQRLRPLPHTEEPQERRAGRQPAPPPREPVPPPLRSQDDLALRSPLRHLRGSRLAVEHAAPDAKRRTARRPRLPRPTLVLGRGKRGFATNDRVPNSGPRAPKR
ncbi:MAG: hypothetical protein KatS3mg015_3161 [Fimbriimonadales bacterium]|nr:MAG: hypothetical protein KatS3mg015_3161 [Fimbriimonadales bacterium]